MDPAPRPMKIVDFIRLLPSCLEVMDSLYEQRYKLFVIDSDIPDHLNPHQHLFRSDAFDESISTSNLFWDDEVVPGAYGLSPHLTLKADMTEDLSRENLSNIDRWQIANFSFNSYSHQVEDVVIVVGAAHDYAVFQFSVRRKGYDYHFGSHFSPMVGWVETAERASGLGNQLIPESFRRH